MKYLSWKEQKINDFSESAVSAMYDRGFVFTRLGKGVMQQTRSCRIDLEKFSLTSENRRILKKMSGIEDISESIPYAKYHWEIAKMAKDFYSSKFGQGETIIMSAIKVKEMLTDTTKSNFNELLVYTQNKIPLGYVIYYENKDMIHYCYPFYDLQKSPKDMGLGMMTRVVDWAKNNRIKYVYLGSLQRPSDTYKLQFEGLEWFDGKMWKTDLEEVKKILASDKIASNE
jgi:arginyl-tRNA--protein-N-Asp/Glu arginylyltransferase